jgi:cytochrome b561
MVLMHWLMLFLIAMVYALMELRSFTTRGSELRLNMIALHYLLGLTVFALAWLRLIVRMRSHIPPLVPPQPPRQAAFAKIMLVLLYALMIGLPVLGWLTLSAKGRPVHLYLFDLPFLLDPNRGLARQLKELHETIANVGYAAIGLHAAMALFHHYVKRDTVLKRMLPQRWRG